MKKDNPILKYVESKADEKILVQGQISKELHQQVQQIMNRYHWSWTDVIKGAMKRVVAEENNKKSNS